MKVAVYAIARNEEKFVKRWLEPLLGVADSITVLDTGSDDDTVALLNTHRHNGVTVHKATINPWRFDDARNVSLALVPDDADIAVCLDLDEVALPGWRDAIEAAWEAEPRGTRLRYPYVWSWLEDGSPGITYYADKVHRRHGYRWKGACHEVLHFNGEERALWTERLVIHHYPDATKSRSRYLELMEVALEEDPNDDRMQHYYARELMYSNRPARAAAFFKQHLDNPRSKWRHERSQTMLYLAACEPEAATTWLYRAVAECPERRETWYALAKHELAHGDPSLAAGFAYRALKTPNDKFYLSDPEAQGDGPISIIREVMLIRERQLKEIGEVNGG